MAKAAFFDVDNTLLRGNIGLMYSTYYFLRGEVPPASLVRIAYYVILHKLNRLEHQDFFHKSLGFLKGREVAGYLAGIKEHYEKKVRRRLDPQALGLVSERRKEGYRIVLLTNGPHLFVDNLAKEIGADDVIASMFEIKEGKLTGKCVQNCYGEMKLSMLKKYEKERKIDPKKSYFYTDSYSDLPTLSHVGHPVAYKPDRKLRRHAKMMGWEIVD